MPEHGPLETLGFFFYAVTPNRTSFETPEEVPNYVIEVVPYFVLLLVLEQCLALYTKRRTLRINDAFGSISNGMLQEITRLLLRSIQFAAYFYVYENWRVTTLPWNSAWTWWICFMGVDLAYYWLHRASHEINFLWAAHQVHHSSEDYNLSTALRQSVLQYHLVWMFYLPLAFAIPPSVFIVHNQFNLLYQFWIHTELIGSLGILEYVLNTASHHRVHHGRNRYCIDKNYGGTLIIWDRIFGTFEPESEEVVYGLTHPINTFEPFKVQLCHYAHIWRTFWEVKGLTNKLSVLVKGPGWSPGTPWHGNIEDIPDVKAPVENYDPKIPHWCKAYVFLHFVIILLGHIEITERYDNFSQAVVLVAIVYQVYSLVTMGILLEGRSYAPWLEILRCLCFFIVDYYFLPVTRLAQMEGINLIFTNSLRAIFGVSIAIWFWHYLKHVRVKLYHSKSQ